MLLLLLPPQIMSTTGCLRGTTSNQACASSHTPLSQSTSVPSHPHSHVPLPSAVRGCAAAGIPRFELASDSQVRRSWRLNTALTTAGPRHMLLVSSRSACLSLVYQISLSLCVQGASAGAPSRSIAGADTAHLAGNSTPLAPPQAQALLHTFHARVLSIPIVVRAGLVLILQWDDWASSAELGDPSAMPGDLQGPERHAWA